MPIVLRTRQSSQAKHRRYDAQRGTSTERGYTTKKWQTYRAQFVGRYSLCGMRPPTAPATTDSLCAQLRRPEPTYVVDHIQPVRGKNDPRFYDDSNLQALCERCHNAKRYRESQRGR